jgi:hypothetical protein
MRQFTLLLASSVLLALPTAPAGAGQCTTEIDSISKFMAAHDAGTGPTAGAPGSAATGTGQHPPTSVMSKADPSTAASRAAAQSEKPQHPPTAAMSRETTGSSMATDEAEPKEPHPPTAAMNQATPGAASPQDVQRQTRGQPPAAQQAGRQIDRSHTLASAMAALEQARQLDRQGSEAECLRAVGEAKLILGAR